MSVSRPAAFVLAMSFVFCAATRVGFGAPPDPCSLLTQAQVGDAPGAAVGVGKSTGKICRWAAPGGRPGMSPALVLTLQDAKEFDFAKRPSASASLVKTPVSGVGVSMRAINARSPTVGPPKADTPDRPRFRRSSSCGGRCAPLRT